MNALARWLLAIVASLAILALALLLAYGAFLLLRYAGGFGILAGLAALLLLWMARWWNRARTRRPPPRPRF